MTIDRQNDWLYFACICWFSGLQMIGLLSLAWGRKDRLVYLEEVRKCKS